MQPLPPPKPPSALVLTAHGSSDPRSGAVTDAIADQIRRLRPSLDVRVAFCERTEPNLRDVLAGLDRPAVVTPLLLASAYHARVDIPAIVAETGADVVQADTLGEDPRLIDALRERLIPVTAAHRSSRVGILVVAVGASDDAANARTASVATELAADGHWAAVRIAFATGPSASAGWGVGEGIATLRDRGARHVVVAPWFIAPGRITDRVAAVAGVAGATMAAPLAAHPLVTATVLDRFDRAATDRVAASLGSAR